MSGRGTARRRGSSPQRSTPPSRSRVAQGVVRGYPGIPPCTVRRGMTWPAGSLVMAVLNEERHPAAAVDAALGQDYPADLELVIALGPSRDRTDEAAAELAARDPRITLVPSPSGRTPVSLNLAIGKTRHPI